MPEDLSAYFSDSEHSITVNGVTKPCVFFEDDSVVLQGSGAGQIAGIATAIVVTADFPNTKGKDPCTVTRTDAGGNILSTRNFTVQKPLKIQDGALTEFTLKNA